MSDYYVRRKELYTSIKIDNFTPDKKWRYVDSYVVNPIVNAYFSDSENKVFATFGICPLVESGTKVVFDANDTDDAFWKMHMLVEMIMLSAREHAKYRPLDLMMSANWEAIQKWEREMVERQQAAQVG